MFMTRPPTVYSLIQLLEEEEIEPQLCKRPTSKSSEVAVADIAGACIPTLVFGLKKQYRAQRVRSFGELTDAAAAVPDVDVPSGASSDDDWPGSDGSSDFGVVPDKSVASRALLAEWEDRFERGLFRYDVTACATKLVPGAHGFVAQCNEGRASKKRPTEFTIDKVEQPFDGAKFNFTKAMQQEVLFAFEPARGGRGSEYVSARAARSPNLVFINVSPIEYGHVLLVPRALDCLNQVVDPAAMLLALEFACEVGDPCFRLGYNSLGAYGTINHLHFQAYFLSSAYPIERASYAPPPKGVPAAVGGVRVSQLAPGSYPIRALVFEAGDSLAALARAVGLVCQALVTANVPHNVLVTDRGARVFLLPNAFSARKAAGEVPPDVLATQVDPAAFELAGHVVLKRQADFDGISQDFCWRMLECASFGDDAFARVAAAAFAWA